MNALRRTVRWTGSIRRRAWLAGLLALLGVGLAVTLLSVSGWLITASGLVGLGALAMIDIFSPGAVIRGAAIGRTVARYGERLSGHDAMLRQLALLRLEAFRRLMRWPVRRLSGIANGDLLTRLTRDIDTLELLLPRWWLPNAAAFGGSLLAVLVFGLAAPALVPIVLALPVIALLMLALIQRAGKSTGRGVVIENARLRADLATWIDGLAELISLGRAAERAGQLIDRVEALVRAQRHQRRLEALGLAATTALGYCAFWGVLIGGLLAVGQGALEAAWAVGLALMMLGLVEAWQAVPGGWVLRANSVQAAERIEALGATEGRMTVQAGSDSVPDADSVRDSGLDSFHDTFPDGAMGTRRCGATVVLSGIRFSWSAASEPVLRDVDLTLAPEERILIEGVSGCGKTTLGRIIAGELPPDEGGVEFDGRDLFRRTEVDRFRLVGRLEQAPLLFRDTIGNNLRIADPGASDERLESALDAVDLRDWFENLPDGLSTWLGERGVGLSGGQGRRLTLARLLLSDCPVLVLDEPTAGLDAVTARRVTAGIQPWLAGRTVVVLSHDPLNDAGITRRLRVDGGQLKAV